jgi:protein-disulfide isomerase
LSSRADEKAQARAAREATEADRQTRERRRRRLTIFGAILATAAVALVAVVLVSSAGEDDEEAAERVSLYEGIPQEGPWLGRPDAPVVVEEYADLQCPFCAAFSEQQLPGIVEDYVRTGRVRLRLRLLTFLGPDSVKGARTAKAAARQNRMWQFVEAFYADQGPENSGFVTDVFLRDLARRAGVDADRALRERNEDAIERDLTEDTDAAKALKVESTPTFAVGPRGGDMQPVTGDDLRGAIDAAAGSAGG